MNIYITDIDNQTCTCPDWQETRENFKFNDPRRLCKHIIKELDINNLPYSIAKFKEYIKFYQEKEWGFKTDFDEIIELSNFTLLGNIDWIDVFDENGIRYGVKKEIFSDIIYWAKQLKPENYEIIEQYLMKESKKIPLPLQKEEHLFVINFIKDVLPSKKDLLISIQDSQYLPTFDGICYDIWESKLTLEQEIKLEQELLQMYDENEAYYKLAQAKSIPRLGNEYEFCMYEGLKVTNSEFIITMYSGKKYNRKRDYILAKQFKEESIAKDKLIKEEEALILEEYERIEKEKLEKRRKIAENKGYLLTKDYNGTIYDIQYEYSYPSELSWDEYASIKKSILDKYDTLENIIKKQSLDISNIIFNKILQELGFLTKELSLNQNNWILRNNGLKFGINLIKWSPYMQKNIPDWYKVYIFDNRKMQLVEFNYNTNIKMTSIVFEINKFSELYDLVKQRIEDNLLTKKDVDIVENNKKTEREKWLKHVDCPNCGEKTNIHKKDKRERKKYVIQRFYCNECNSMFQIKLEELEKRINDYQKQID